ncbi:MAG TPA: Ig-like domain-containing protein [Propionicimonas sp.]|nr:Ig-like domain-containing protein [Propionicimonas sp.]
MSVPTGVVTASYDGVQVSSGNLVDGAVDLHLAGTALPAGVRTVELTYSGDDLTNSSETTVVVSVAKAATNVTAATTPKRPNRQSKVTLSVTVAATGAVPEGKVKVTVGGKAARTVKIDGNGQARISLGRLKKGKHTVLVRYLGSTSFEASRASLKVTVRG